MLSKYIRFRSFSNKTNNAYIFKIYNNLKKNYFINKVKILNSLSHNYKYSYNSKILNKYKHFQYFRVIGMGGSVLGSKAIYQFLNYKIKKFFFS